MQKQWVWVWVLCFFLGACGGRGVEVIDAQQFKLMADRMPKELIARDILDTSRYYTPGVWEDVAQNYGTVLLNRLSPNFLFDEMLQSEKAQTFAAMKGPKDKLYTRPHGFSITSPPVVQKGRKKAVSTTTKHLDVDMVAITDWDGDGQKDWLIACRRLQTKAGNPRIYYIVVANPMASGILHGQVVSVYDDMGVFGRLYMREHAPGIPTAPVEDVIPGLRSVTVPPTTTQEKSHDGLVERPLE